MCRRCHQRLPNQGLAAGVTYPRRRNVANDTSASRWAVYAAIALAIIAFIVGAVFVGLSRPPGPGSSFVAIVTPPPAETLPPFEQPTPTPTPFVSLAPTPSLLPTPTPEITPTISAPPTIEPTPAPTPTPTTNPTPTPTPVAFTCDAVTGTPSEFVEVGSERPVAETRNWCLETATFQFFAPSAWGTIRLRHNGRTIAEFTCDYPTICSAPVTVPVRGAPRLALRGDLLRFVAVNCQEDPATPEDECENPGIFAKITVGYERATRP